MGLFDFISNLLDRKYSDTSVSKIQEQDDYWDGTYIHFCTESYQSCQNVGVACGIRLSTWAKPGTKRGNSKPEDIGYSFTTKPVNCPKCVEWMKAHLNRCKNCKDICQYNYCNECAEKELIKDGLCLKCHTIPCRCKK